MTTCREARWDPRYGIARRHWRIFSDYARARGLYLFLRGGKEAAIRFIERGFPGKPLELSFLKVDPRRGLLFARTDGERTEVYRRGHLVLRPGPARTRTGLLPFDAGGPRHALRVHGDWAEEDLVIERGSLKPFTCDYDLGAVVSALDWDYESTFASWATPAGAAGLSSRTSPFTESVRNELNRLMESERIRHGSEAQYSGQLSHQSEDVVAFTPYRKAMCLRVGGSQVATAMRDVLMAMMPERTHLFWM